LNMSKLNDFELRTSPGLWRRYDQTSRRLGFDPQYATTIEHWQRTLRNVVDHLLGERASEPCDLDPHRIESGEMGGLKHELIVIQTRPGEYTPCHILFPPDGTPPYRPLIALHGHGTWGAKGILGVAESDHASAFIRQLNYDYARQFALRGHLVFAPVLRGFGERMETPPDASKEGEWWLSSCRELSLNALLLGQTLLGLRVWDVMRLIDYVRSRSEPMVDGLACVGLSGGGTVTLFTAALDARISCAVVSGYMNTFRDSIMSMEHCVCNYVPGIVQYAEIADIAGLIAPRPLLVESGTSDPIYPVAGTEKAVETLRQIYRCFEAEDCLETDFFEGVHEWSGRKAYDWMARWL
jgi:hypothetical protein